MVFVTFLLIGFPKLTHSPQFQVIFSVLVAGYPEPRVNFYRDGKRLKPNERITIGKQHTVLYHFMRLSGVFRYKYNLDIRNTLYRVTHHVDSNLP